MLYYFFILNLPCFVADCSSLFPQNDIVTDCFRKITTDLSTLVDVFPVKELQLNDDVHELVILIRKQCSESRNFVHLRDKQLRDEVLTMLDRIKKRLLLSKLEIFERLEMRVSEIGDLRLFRF